MAFNLAVLVAGLLVLELAFGGWLRRDSLYRLGPLRDVAMHYDVSRIYETPTPRITYSRDKYGFRGRYGGDAGAIEMLTVGGSTTDQRYIDDGRTWQDLLQARFAEAGRSIVIANAGLDGQSTVGHLQAFDWWFPNIPHLKPRFILFYVGINDFYVRDGEARDTMDTALMAALQNNSAVWRLTRTLWGVYLAEFVFGIGHRRVDFAHLSWTREGLQRDYGFMNEHLAAYAARLSALVDKTRRFGSEPIFVSQPTHHVRWVENNIEGDATVSAYAGHDINGVDRYKMMRCMDATMDEVSRARHVPFIDLAGYARWDDTDFYDFQHMTPSGIAKLSHDLFDDLSPLVSPAW